MPRTSLGRRRRADDVADHLERAIASGEFAQGSELPAEKDLAERFSVGRPAVREALFMLQQQGLVSVMSGRRARVAAAAPSLLSDQAVTLIKRISATPEGQQHMEEVRMLFEPGIAWQAARIATDADIRGLKEKLDANVVALGNTPEFIRTDVAFHYELTAITRNPVLIAMHDTLIAWLIDQRANTIYMPQADTRSVRDHTAIYEAVAAHDSMRAFHEMVSHLRLISEMYRESKRIADDVLRKMVNEVSDRVEREMAQMWEGAAERIARSSRPGSKQE